MEELDVLKKNWETNQHIDKQVSENQILVMLHRGSSSVVRWIFIVGILEFLLWIGISILSYDDNALNSIGLQNYETWFDFLTIFNYVGICVFIVLFYKNYRAVSTTTNTKKLMQSILKVRKTVNYYVSFNLFLLGFGMLFILILGLLNTPQLEKFREIMFDGNHKLKLFLIMLFLLAIISVMIVVFWLFYKLLYGFFLKKLFNNYKELQKMDL